MLENKKSQQKTHQHFDHYLKTYLRTAYQYKSQ